MPGAGVINLDLNNFLGGIFGHPKEAEAAADAQTDIASIQAQTQQAIALEQIQSQAQVQNKIADTIKLIGVGFLGILAIFALSRLW